MFWEVTKSLWNGFTQNLVIFGVVLILALPLSLPICFGAMSKFKLLKWLTKTFIWVMRGVPLMLQLFIVFYVPGLVFGMPFESRITAVFIAFSINYAVFFAEDLRGALENIPKGQWEAGAVLGLSKWQIFKSIILLQIIKRITAPLGNECINLVKDTALARIIAVPEMLMTASSYTTQGHIYPLFYTGAFFLAATGIVQIIFIILERRLKYAFGEKSI